MNFIFDPTVTFGDILGLIIGFVFVPLFVHFKKNQFPLQEELM